MVGLPGEAIATYADLLVLTADWLNRADLTARIPIFVRLAEADFNRELRVRDMLVRSIATSNAEQVAMPDDFLETYSLTLTPGTAPTRPLRYMSEAESNDLKARGAYGPVIGYTIIDGMFELVPAPSGDVELKLVYYASLPALGEEIATGPLVGIARQENWLLTKSPDLYLYSTLLQSAPYLNDATRLQTWAAMRTALMEAVRMESEAGMRPRSGMTAMARSF